MMAAQPQSLIGENQAVVIRRVTPEDAAVCGRIGFEAFATLANKHNFPSDFPTPEHAARVLSMMFSHSSFFCVVAEQDGKLIGSNFLDERTPIVGVGPITVDHAVQNRAAGREAALVRNRMSREDRAESRRDIVRARRSDDNAIGAKSR